MNNNSSKMTLPFAWAHIQALYQTLCSVLKKSPSQAHKSIPKIEESRKNKNKNKTSALRPLLCIFSICSLDTDFVASR